MRGDGDGDRGQGLLRLVSHVARPHFKDLIENLPCHKGEYLNLNLNEVLKLKMGGWGEHRVPARGGG